MNLKSSLACRWNRRVNRAVLGGLVMVAWTAAHVQAQSSPSGARPADAPDPLRGPSVPATAAPGTPSDPLQAPMGKTDMATGARPTLIERGFDGELKRVERDPTLLALDKLGLDADTRFKADQIIIARQAILDSVVADNLKPIIELNNARQAGDQAAVRRVFADVLGKVQPLLKRGRLIDELKDVLPPEKHAMLTEMVNEYFAASIKERIEKPRSDLPAPAGLREKQPGGRQAVANELIQTLGLEVKASYERVVGSAQADFEDLIKQLSLTPEQEGKTRQVFGDLAQKSYGKATQLQRSRAFLEVYRLLDSDQRKIILEKLRKRNAAPAR